MSERLALIGAGNIGRRHQKAIAETDTAHLVAIVDPDLAAGDLAKDWQVPHYSETTTMLKETNPSGVIVATPTEFHLEPSLAALHHGCHLLIEKPIASTLEEAEQLVNLSEESGRHILVGHHRRYYPQVEMAREMVRGGTLGQLVTISGQWSIRKPDAYYEPEWRRRWQAGPVLTNLIHEVDYLRYIAGEIVSVTGEIGNPVQQYEKEDTAAFVLRFEHGAIGAFILSDQADSPWAWELATGENPSFPKSGQNCVQFAGTKGALDFPNLRHWTSEGGVESWTTPKSVKDIPMDLGDAYIRQIEHFADVIAGVATPKITAADATSTLKVTLAVLESGATGARVRV